MASGGTFKLEGRENPIVARQNTFIKHYTGEKYQQIDIKNGQKANMNTQANSNLAEFKISTSLGRTIFSNVLALDGNANDLSEQDFNLINETKLQQLCKDKSIKIKEKDDANKRIVLEYSYNGVDKATLVLDLESKMEEKSREIDEIKKATEANRVEQERKNEQQRKANLKNAKNDNPILNWIKDRWLRH